VHARGNELRVAFRELRQVIFDTLTSKTVRRFVINSVLFCVFAAFTYYLSIPAYAAFYRFYLPDQIVTVPLHFQYGFVLVPPCVDPTTKADTTPLDMAPIHSLLGLFFMPTSKIRSRTMSMSR